MQYIDQKFLRIISSEEVSKEILPVKGLAVLMDGPVKCMGTTEGILQEVAG